MSEIRVFTGSAEYPPTTEGYLADRLHQGQYHLEDSVLGARHISLTCDSFRSDKLNLQDTQRERLAQFEEELQTPTNIYESTTGSYYKGYSFNRDFQEKGPGDSVIVFFPPLSSCPSAEQGQAALWQLCQYFPDHLILSVGNEGTLDARASDEWLTQADPTVIAETRRLCILQMLENYEKPPLNISLIGQSMGGTIAFNVAKLLEQGYQLPDKLTGLEVKRLIMTSTPVAKGSTLSLCKGLAKQETPALLLAPFADKIKFARHVGKSLVPAFTGPDAGRNLLAYRRLISSVAASQVRAEGLAPNIEVSFITGERDKRAQLNDFIRVPEDWRGTEVDIRLIEEIGMLSNVLGVTVKGQKHSAFLLAGDLCGQTVKLVWDCPRN